MLSVLFPSYSGGFARLVIPVTQSPALQRQAKQALRATSSLSFVTDRQNLLGLLSYNALDIVAALGSPWGEANAEVAWQGLRAIQKLAAEYVAQSISQLSEGEQVRSH